tara:strand:+ start:125 stop:475 length:351 start_codon:yes stop_codon:yes gene_type:complete
MNLAKKYKQLFEGKIRSNDSKLIKESVDIDDWIDWKKMRKINDVDRRGDYNLYEDGEEITVPLKKPINGKREFIATVSADDGYTSFTFEEEDEEAMESVGIDTLNDLGDFMTDSMF